MKLGISLAGGGIKGAAHIGVLKAFEEKNIKIDSIAGTSSGSIVAALYAIGYTADEMYNLFKKYCKRIGYITPKNVIKLIFGMLFFQKIIITGLNNGNTLEKIMEEACKYKKINNINQIHIPLMIPSVNLENGELTMFSSIEKRAKYEDNIKYVNNISIAKAVRCSCSYPGVFEPACFNNQEFIDGGIRENVPWKELKKTGVDKVICVVFEEETKKENCKKNIVDVVASSIDILSHELSNYELNGADELLKIKTDPVSLIDCSKLDYLYEKGYYYGIKRLEKGMAL